MIRKQQKRSSTDNGMDLLNGNEVCLVSILLQFTPRDTFVSSSSFTCSRIYYWLLRLENTWRANGLLYCCYEVVLLYFRSGGLAVFWSRWLHPQRLKAEIVMFAAETLRYQI
jgi:hypothetical protein